MDPQQLRNILESCLLVAGKALSLAQLESLFEEDIDRPERSEIKQALTDLQAEYEDRGIELVEVSSGWRLQSSKSMEHWVGRLFQEKQPRYSRALLETLVLIAYRQPITRGEIEDVRGVAVSSNIIRTLQEREWIKEMGYKDVPGKPALWGTTKEFLDYFNLKRLDELPTLAEARDLAEIDAALAAEVGLVDGVTDGVAANDSEGDGADGSEVAASDGESGESDSAGSETSESGDSDTEVDVSEEQASESDVSESDAGDLGTSDPVTGDPVAGESAAGEENEDVEGSTFKNLHESIVTPHEAESQERDDEHAEAVDLKAESSNEETDDTAGTELINLAANLGKEREPEPGLGELADNFDADADADADALNGTDSALDSQSVIPVAVGLLHSADSLTDEETVGQGSATTDSDDDQSLTTDSSTSQSGKAHPTEAMEISAHDLDIEEWKEPASQRPVADNPNDSSSDDSVVDVAQPQAQSDLRRVIDDFAEEHRKQIDADSERQAKNQTTHDDARQSPSAHLDDVVQEQPVTTESDDTGVVRTQHYGIHGTVESDLDPDAESESDESEDHSNDDSAENYSGKAKGEP